MVNLKLASARIGSNGGIASESGARAMQIPSGEGVGFDRVNTLPTLIASGSVHVYETLGVSFAVVLPLFSSVRVRVRNRVSGVGCWVRVNVEPFTWECSPF